MSTLTRHVAILIDRYTIHSLTSLPHMDNKFNLESFKSLWDKVCYLIIDEVSMVLAIMMAQISDHISRAWGFATSLSNTSFGKTNVIFLGDFGQLKLVIDKPLFAYSLVEVIKVNQKQMPPR